MAKRNEASGSRLKNYNKPVAQKQTRPKRNGFQLPEKLPSGEILTDIGKKQWRLGKSIGVGGFGEIYSASDDITRAVPDNAQYVVKIEPHENGPLFTETHFYIKAGKAEMIENWKLQKKLKFIGMPRMVTFGSHHVSGVKYRFLVMDRFGVDVQKIFEANKKKLSYKSAFSLAIQLLDVLEYIHSTGYVHADIKGSNLLLGYNNENEIYLVDYGLACKYVSDNKHKVYEEDPRRAHDGTIEFTSRDAHVGAHSRRGDMEILAYNVVQWLCSRLPWEDHLKDQERVHVEKKNFMKNLPKSLISCFRDETPPDCLTAYLKYVAQLEFQQEPDYNHCRKLFINGLKKAGIKHDGKLDLKYKPTVALRRTVKPPVNDEDDNYETVDAPPAVKRGKLNLGTRSTNPKASPTKKVVKSRSQEELLKSKSKSKSENSLNSGVNLPVKEVPTPAMLLVMKMREQQHKKTNGKTNGKALSTKKAAAAAASTARAAAPSESDESSQEEFFTPPTTRRSSRKRVSSLSVDLNSTATPELF